MSDFYQTSSITTLHRLGTPNLELLEQELAEHARTCPIALVLPCLYSELEGPALGGIVEHLKKVPYLNEIVVALGHASALEFRQAKEYFAVLPQDVRLVWIEGPRIQELLKLLVSQGVNVGLPGKGQSCWIAFGYVLARRRSKVIALHDCDIVTYDRDYVARLCYPVVNPGLGYEFCKGYYARVTDRLHGRVTRLFISPMIRALQRLVGPNPLLTFLDSFRYPLAGEFAMVTDLAWTNRIPGDWGLEIGVLAEVYRNCALRRVCQADLSDKYEHKHQTLSADNPNAGLHKMCVDISKALFRNLANEDDAAINSLQFQRNEERMAVEAFLKGIKLASEGFLEDPLGVPMISNWARVTAAVPDIFDRLIDAVETDCTWAPKGHSSSAGPHRAWGQGTVAKAEV